MTRRLTPEQRRWLRKARRVYTVRARRDGTDYNRQAERAFALARDVWHALDPKGAYEWPRRGS